MSYTVYVLKDRYNRIYVGQTKNFDKRLEEHVSGKTKSLRNRNPFEVLYTEIVETRVEAVQRELALKSGQGRAWLKSKIMGL